MESKTDLQHFLTDAQTLWLILKRRWRPAAIVSGGLIGLAILSILVRKPTYVAKGKVLLERNTSTSSLTESGRQIGELQSLYGNPLDTEAVKIRSLPLVQKTIDTLQLVDDEGEPLKPEAVIKKKLKLGKIRGTDVLEIGYRSNNPQEAANVVNKLMALYQESSVQADRAKAVAARNFILQQLPLTEAAVRQAELGLRRFKEANNVADLAREASLSVEAIAQLQEQMGAARTQLQRVEAQSQLLAQRLGMTPEAALDMSIVSQTPGVQEALTRLQAVEERVAIAQSDYQDEHPIVAELRAEETSLTNLLQSRIQQALGTEQSIPVGNAQARGLQQELFADLFRLQVENAGLNSRIQALDTERATLQQRLQLLPRLEQEQRQYESKLAAARSAYELLLKKLQEIRITENQTSGNAQILEYAAIPEKIELRPIALRLALGLLLAGLGAIATIVILEIRDATLKTVKEVREFLGYTLLGVIPTIGKDEQSGTQTEDNEAMPHRLIVRELPRSPISEAYRMLQSNLKFLHSDQVLKTIVVTSCVIGEGKSTVSANLAMTIAQREHRVLLVDADLRRPIQHHIWDLVNGPGLSDLLVGQAEAKTAIQVINNDLHVLSAGVLPPNPGTLLDSKRMASLFKYFAEHYDYVIFDTPSLSVADDPRILGKMADGVLLVVRPGLVDAHNANSAKEFLNQAECNILGLVVNGVIREYELHNYDYHDREYGLKTEASHLTRSASQVRR